MDPSELWGIGSHSTSSPSSENLSVLFSKQNVWLQVFPSFVYLWLHGQPGVRPLAPWSDILFKKQAKTTGSPWSKRHRDPQNTLAPETHQPLWACTSLCREGVGKQVTEGKERNSWLSPDSSFLRREKQEKSPGWDSVPDLGLQGTQSRMTHLPLQSRELVSSWHLLHTHSRSTHSE